MSYRIKPQDITVSGSSPFMTRHAARCTTPLADAVASEELFLNVRSNLRAGDQVLLCRYETGDWNKARVLEYVELIITQSTALAVEFEAMGEVRTVGEAKPDLEPEKSDPELAELKIEPDPQGGYNVVDANTGYVHKNFKTEPAAKRYITDYGKKAAA